MKLLRFLLLAALVAMPLTACDDDNGGTQTPAVGTVTGTVTAEGTGLSGVSVTLSGATSQSATTGSGGTYTFTNVEAGSYSVSIDASSQPDVSFSQTAKTTSITTDGQTQTVDFAGQYIRTASIVGSVTSSGAPLVGVSVTVSGGPDGTPKSDATNAGGEYAITGLRAGTYTVTISDVPAGVSFTSLSKSVTVGTGETKTAIFAGTAEQLATISGAVTVDNVGMAGVAVALSVGATASTETGPGGAFAFTNLSPGSYTVTITPPEDVTFTTTSKDVTVNAGETAVVNFAGVTPAEPATISIQSITKGGAPIDLTDVNGQIEITLNVLRNDQTLDYVNVLIGNVIVATQDFAEGAAAAPAEAPTGEPEIVTLNVPTTQVMMGANGWTPAVVNGGNEISANLYVVEGTQPIPTNKVPVVIQNVDAVIPGMDVGGNLTITPDEPERTALGEDEEVWYAGSATLSGPLFLAYTTIVPDEVEFTAQCEVSSMSITGDHTTGIPVTNTYDCDDWEGTLMPYYEINVDYPTTVGPDGTAVMFNEDDGYGIMSALGAEFYLGDGTVGPRRFVILDPNPDQIEESNSLNMDNKAPTVSLDLPVAFNDEFSEYWVKGDYNFVDMDMDSEDFGVGYVTEQTFLWVQGEPGSCTGAEVVTPDASGLDETLVSDGDPDGYQICGYAYDALMNGAYTDASNWFGVDMTAPQVRIWGDEGSEDPGVLAPYGEATGDTPVSDALNTTVYGTAEMMGTGDYDYASRDEMEWGLDGIDDRSGLDDLEGWPFVQEITHDGVTPTACTSEATDYGDILTDHWVRIDAGTDFLCGIEEPGIFTYTGYVVDRAGNQSTHFYFNWLVDEIEGPVTTAITPVATSYAPGDAGYFNVWGSDDLEVTKLGFYMTYPVSDFGDLSLFYGDQGVAADRWDDQFENILAGDQFGVSKIWGRIDVTDTDGSVPGELTYAAGEDALPTDVSVFLDEDAGYNPGQEPVATWIFIEYAYNGWDSVVEAPWPDANLDSWTLEDDGEQYVAQHIGDSSIDVFIFDQVWLAMVDPNTAPPTMTVCAVKAGTDHTYTDNGVNRFYTFTFDYPEVGDTCGDPPINASMHAVGVLGDALLVTQYDEIIPNPEPTD